MNYTYDQKKKQKHFRGENLARYPAGIAQGQVELLGAVLGKSKKASLTSLSWCERGTEAKPSAKQGATFIGRHRCQEDV